MALTSALFTGLSGLNVNQTRLNVVGNNIANANTVSFKASRALFAPQFYVTEGAGGPPSADFGGSNPSQRGLGATVAAIEKDFAQGTLETTGKDTDLAIDGSGFFVVEGAERRYTRDGAFTLNANNELVTQRGDYVLGYGADDSGEIIDGQLVRMRTPTDSIMQAQATSNVSMQGNLNPDGEVATGASVLTSAPLLSISGAGAPLTAATVGTTLLSDVSLDGTTPMFSGATPDTLTIEGVKGGRTLPELDFEITPTSTVQDLIDFINQGMQIKTDETSPAGFNPPGATIEADGRLTITSQPGEENAISLSGTAFRSTNAAMTMAFTADATSNPIGESITTSFEVYDSLGTPVAVDVTAYLVDKDDTGSTWNFIASSPENTRAQQFTPGGAGPTAFYGAIISSGTLKFSTEGALTEATGASITLDRSDTGAVAAQAIDIDFTALTGLAAKKSSFTLDNQDGFATGTINGFGIGPNGTITGTYSNGQNKTLGRLVIAQFDNPAGLVDEGGNIYAPGGNSGTPIIAGPLEFNGGAVRSGTLELSNVDLSREFINLIISSTGFTAASRVISTSDQLITELLNTTR